MKEQSIGIKNNISELMLMSLKIKYLILDAARNGKNSSVVYTNLSPLPAVVLLPLGIWVQPVVLISSLDQDEFLVGSLAQRVGTWSIAQDALC